MVSGRPWALTTIVIFFGTKRKSKISLLEDRDRCGKFVHALVCVCKVTKKETALGAQCQSIMEGNILSDNLLRSVYIATLTGLNLLQ